MSAFDEFKAYWAVAEEMIAKAIKEPLPRSLASSRYRQLPIPGNSATYPWKILSPI